MVAATAAAFLSDSNKCCRFWHPSANIKHHHYLQACLLWWLFFSLFLRHNKHTNDGNEIESIMKRERERVKKTIDTVAVWCYRDAIKHSRNQIISMMMIYQLLNNKLFLSFMSGLLNDCLFFCPMKS